MSTDNHEMAIKVITYPKDIDYRRKTYKLLHKEVRLPGTALVGRTHWIGIIDLMQDLGKDRRIPLLFFKKDKTNDLREDCYYQYPRTSRKPLYVTYYFKLSEKVFKKILDYQKRYQAKISPQNIHIMIEEDVDISGRHVVEALLPNDGTIGYLNNKMMKEETPEFFIWKKQYVQKNGKGKIERIVLLTERAYEQKLPI